MSPKANPGHRQHLNPHPKTGRKRGKNQNLALDQRFSLYSDLSTTAEHSKAVTRTKYLHRDQGSNKALNFKQEPEQGG